MSHAGTLFQTALDDVNNLMEFHANQGGNARGRRSIRLSSLNKSGIVLLCAAWESYVEAVILECARRAIGGAATPTELPRAIQKLVTNHVREGKNEAAWRTLAGDGWRAVAEAMVLESKLNTPKTGPIRELLTGVLGVEDMDATWSWAKNPVGGPSGRLNDLVTLRGAIAHGEILNYTVTKVMLTQAVDLISRLVEKVDERLTAEGLLP